MDQATEDLLMVARPRRDRFQALAELVNFHG
jgi:hypothetical protein